MNRLSPLLSLVVLAGAAAAQDLKDPTVLAPEGHRVYVRLDVAKLRESELWRVLSRNVVVKGWLEGGFGRDTGLDPEDLKQLQAFTSSMFTVRGQEQRSSSLITGTANLNVTSIKEAMEKRGGTRDETASYDAEEVIGGRRVWMHREPHIPCLVELGPGAVWLASPPEFVRARLTELAKGNPVFKPNAELEPLRSRDGGELFLASCDPYMLSAVNDLLPAMASRFTALSLRGDLMGDVVLAATGLLAIEEKAAATVDTLRGYIAEAIAVAEKQRIPLAVTYLKKVELAAKGRELTATLKIEQKQIAGVVTAVMALVPMVAMDRAQAADGAARAAASRAAEIAPASKPAGK